MPLCSFADGHSVQVYAHRGARAFSPENTIPAYKTGLKIGTDWVDMDIQLTKDGELIVCHDLVLNPKIVRDAQGHYVPQGKYVVKNLTLQELEQFDVGRLKPGTDYAKFFPDQLPVDGTKMPSLREVIRFVNRATKNHVGFQIEMKTSPEHPEWSSGPKVFAEALYKVLKEEKIIDRSEIQAFDFRCLVELQKLDHRVKTAYLTSRENSDPAYTQLWSAGHRMEEYGSFPKMVKALGGYAWEPEDFELTQEALDEAHRLGLKVVVWTWPEKLGTAYDPQMIARLIDWGVDGIINDDPGRLTSMLAARGMRVPNRYLLQ